MQSCVHSCQETISSPLKQWEILNVVYHHDIMTHGTVLRAITFIIHQAIEDGEPFVYVLKIPNSK